MQTIFANNFERTGVCTASCESSYGGIGWPAKAVSEGTTKNAHTQVKRENYARKLLKVLLSRLFYPKIVKKCNSNLNFRVFLLYYIIA